MMKIIYVKNDFALFIFVVGMVICNYCYMHNKFNV